MTREQRIHLTDAEVPVLNRAEIRDIEMDRSIPAERRAESYLRQIKNPYAFKCGETIVNVRFSMDGRSLKDALVSYFAAAQSSGRR